MRQPWSEKLKQAVRPSLYRLMQAGKERFRCPICDYHGPFKDKVVTKSPLLVRKSSKCPKCVGVERHRLMHLVLGELLKEQDPGGKSLLHIAPEECLENQLRAEFGTYHSADLFRKDVDYCEDLQKMTFPDGSYDWVVVSRVLISPPDLEACVSECRRVLKPGGVFVVAEYYPRETTDEYGEMRGDRSRELGVDVIDLYRKYFQTVDLYDSLRYDRGFQLVNRTELDGAVFDDYPDLVRAPGEGLKDVVAVCRVGG